MVTETIEQEDVHPRYMNIHYWIRAGITEDAIGVCRIIWILKNNLNSHWRKTRNKDDKFKDINLVIKW